MKKLFPLLFLLIISCAKEEVIVDEYADCKPVIVDLKASLADAETGLIEFDIRPSKNQNKGSVTSDADLLWDKGIVPYVIQGTRYLEGGGQIVGINREEDKEKIRAALSELSKETGILFPEYETESELYAEHKDGVKIIAGWKYSTSFLGRQGRIQTITLGLTLEKSVIQHEFMHALGFNHEFTRSDRDEYVNIYFENIPEDMHRQFEMKENSKDCGGFDLNSIMMYGSFNVQKDSSKIEMTLKDGSIFERKTTLSEGDIKSVKSLYEDKFKEREKN